MHGYNISNGFLGSTLATESFRSSRCNHNEICNQVIRQQAILNAYTNPPIPTNSIVMFLNGTAQYINAL